MGEVYVENRHTTPGTIDVVERGGERIHSSTHEIDGADDSGRRLLIEGGHIDQRP
ncbi:hypothetical protein ACNS7O_06270 [Haloferacaceae archaeon DSL9]